MKNLIKKLRKSKVFKSEKIVINFSTGDVSNQLCAYLLDNNGKKHLVLWEIYPDRNLQSFDKSIQKVYDFIKSKVIEWLSEEENEIIENKKKQEKILQDKINNLNDLQESF